MDETHNPNLKSWIDVNSDSHFPIQNLPFGVFRPSNGGDLHVCTIIGDYVIDLSILDLNGFFANSNLQDTLVFDEPTLNAFMSLGRDAWKETRLILSNLFSEDNSDIRDSKIKDDVLFHVSDVEMRLPVDIGDYTDFYSSKEHATNVGKMFRGEENALMPNWLHLPVAYHGRASSVVVSGTDIKRPSGQMLTKDSSSPSFGVSNRLDFELEMGFLVGPGNSLGNPISTQEAENHIFGLALVNDWSARDIQKWEYQPLGPFLGKSFATSISPWVITLEALEPFRCSGPKQNPKPLSYLDENGKNSYDINLEVSLQPANSAHADIVCNTNFKHLYWSMSQQLAHHTVNGCNLRTGDLLASGTISGPSSDSYGSLLELSWNGTEPINLSNNEKRTFLHDHDSIFLTGWCQNDSYRIGFGTVSGQITPSN
tara:strand:- start:12919 stop:14196 length:1278 start_codon:yes stop_codon:yes gene_type:complete